MKSWMSLWLPVLLWAGFIFYLSNIPYLRITPEWWDYPLRKLCHMGEYGVLAMLLFRAFSGSTAWPKSKLFWVSITLAVLYSISDEVHQNYVAGRVGAAHDVLIDGFGAWLLLKISTLRR
jgi:VanZ family protein